MSFSRFGLMVAAVLAFSPTLASAAIVDFNFTDSHGDVVDLILQTSGPVAPTGSSLTSITGTFNGLSISGPIGFAGSDNVIYGSGPLVDYSGIAWVTSADQDFNLYWTNHVRGATPGGLGVCYVSTCNTTTGFYAVSAIPEPSIWAMLLLGFGGIGFMAYPRRSKPALLAA